MERLGLTEVTERIMVRYEKKKSYQLEHTLLKILYRCSLAYRSLTKFKKIGAMIRRKAELRRFFIEKQRKTIVQESAADKEAREELLAGFCLQCARIFIQINQFLDESGYFKGTRFVIGGKDVQEALRADIGTIKKKYQPTLTNTIPVMDEDGRLVFDKEEIAQLE